jgi:hypothetical protein
MKLPAILLSSLFIATPAFADGYRYGNERVFQESHCYENVEEYIPGYYNKHGQYVGGYVKHRRHKIPCGHNYTRHNRRHDHRPVNNVDDNSCIEGSILGGIAGGGIGAAASRGDGRLWAIPLGIVGGAMVGCQIDGG